MARAERDKAARSDGDVVHGALVPLVGSAAGAALAIRSVSTTVGEPLRGLWADGYDSTREATQLIASGAALVARTGGLVLLGALAGGLVAGLLQTRGYFGRPTREAARIRATPSVWLALLGWAGLFVAGLFVCRTVLGLHPAEPTALADASAQLFGRFAAIALGGLATLALVDHALKVRARSVRLGLDEAPPRARPIIEVPTLPTPRWDEVFADARWVVFDAQRAVVIGTRDGQPFITARFDGALVDAVCNAARARGLPALQVADLQDASVPPDIALSNQRLAAWGITLPPVGEP